MAPQLFGGLHLNQWPCVSVGSNSPEAAESGRVPVPWKNKSHWAFIWGDVDTSQLHMWDPLILHKEPFVHNKHGPFGGRMLIRYLDKRGLLDCGWNEKPQKACRYVDDREHTTGMPGMPLPGDR